MLSLNGVCSFYYDYRVHEYRSSSLTNRWQPGNPNNDFCYYLVICKQNMYMLLLLPAQIKLVLQQVMLLTPVYGVNPAYFIQSECSIHATCNKLLCSKTGLNVVCKTRNIAIQLVLQKSCKICHMFTVACVTLARPVMFQ